MQAGQQPPAASSADVQKSNWPEPHRDTVAPSSALARAMGGPRPLLLHHRSCRRAAKLCSSSPWSRPKTSDRLGRQVFQSPNSSLAAFQSCPSSGSRLKPLQGCDAAKSLGTIVLGEVECCALLSLLHRLSAASAWHPWPNIHTQLARMTGVDVRLRFEQRMSLACL